MPLDVLVYRRDALDIELQTRITEEDAYFKTLRERWSAALRQAYREIPEPPWS